MVAPMTKTNSLRAFKYIEGQVVMVGKAEQELDHGQSFWLCSTLPPFKQRFEPTETREQAIAWLQEHVGAEEVFEGIPV